MRRGARASSSDACDDARLHSAISVRRISGEVVRLSRGKNKKMQKRGADVRPTVACVRMGGKHVTTALQ